jgi:hypothetical protein
MEQYLVSKSSGILFRDSVRVYRFGQGGWIEFCNLRKFIELEFIGCLGTEETYTGKRNGIVYFIHYDFMYP